MSRTRPGERVPRNQAMRHWVPPPPLPLGGGVALFILGDVNDDISVAFGVEGAELIHCRRMRERRLLEGAFGVLQIPSRCWRPASSSSSFYANELAPTAPAIPVEFPRRIEGPFPQWSQIPCRDCVGRSHFLISMRRDRQLETGRYAGWLTKASLDGPSRCGHTKQPQLS